MTEQHRHPGAKPEVLSGLADRFARMAIYERFEHAIILILTSLTVLVIAAATWRLLLSVVQIIVSDDLTPGNQAVFQAIFGMMFTVIIGLEFKHSLLIVLFRQESVVRVRSIILIAMLAMVRKFIILDLSESAAAELFALSASILALGVVYWLVRDQDRRLATLTGSSAAPPVDQG